MLATLTSILALSALTSAVPTDVQVRSSAVTDLPYNFTLAALNTTLPNANTTGSPLVLGAAGAVDGASFQETATWASYPYNDYTPLALVNSSVRVVSNTGAWYTNATAISNGGVMSWLTTGELGNYAATGFSAVEGGSFPTLAWNGVVDQWSLCPSTTGSKETNLVYNVTADVPPPPYLGFDPSTCWSVTINIVKA